MTFGTLAVSIRTSGPEIPARVINAHFGEVVICAIGDVVVFTTPPPKFSEVTISHIYPTSLVPSNRHARRSSAAVHRKAK